MKKTIIAYIVGAALAVSAFAAETISYAYDDAGRLTQADYGGPKIEYVYDANGNLLRRAASGGGGGATYTLRYLAGTGGQISGADTQAVAAGDSGTPVNAAPASYYQFVQWSDGRADNPRTDTNVTASLTVTAQFAALLAAQGTPHWWLAEYGWSGDFDAAELTDSDQDGHLAWQEYVADTNPTNASSRLRITDFTSGLPVRVSFDPASAERLYTLQAASSLPGDGWTNVPGQGPRPGGGETDQMTDTNIAPARFYRVAVALP
jgi:YD repeat-containing protein